MLTFACCELGYVLATEVRGGTNATSTVVFWLTAAVLAGPPLGVATGVLTAAVAFAFGRLASAVPRPPARPLRRPANAPPSPSRTRKINGPIRRRRGFEQGA